MLTKSPLIRLSLSTVALLFIIKKNVHAHKPQSWVSSLKRKKNRSSHDINTISNFNSRPGLVESEYNSACYTQTNTFENKWKSHLFSVSVSVGLHVILEHTKITKRQFINIRERGIRHLTIDAYTQIKKICQNRQMYVEVVSDSSL